MPQPSEPNQEQLCVEKDSLIESLYQETDNYAAWLYFFHEYIRSHYGSHVIQHIQQIGKQELPRILETIMNNHVGDEFREAYQMEETVIGS